MTTELMRSALSCCPNWYRSPSDRPAREPNSPVAERIMSDVQEAAAQRAAAPYPKGQHRRRDQAAFSAIVQLRTGALVISNRCVLNTRREQCGAGITPCRPAIYEWREVARLGRPDQLRIEPSRRMAQCRGLRRKISTAQSPAICRSSNRPNRAGHQSQDREGLGLTSRIILARADEVIE